MMLDRTLIISVFVVASCGIAYELIAAALASYLLGDSILQYSSIIGTYLFAMGVGSHLSKHVPEHRLLASFIDIELIIGLIGGVSATLLFLMFGWQATPFRLALYALVVVIGVLVGLEIPLVMRLLNQRDRSFSDIVSRVLTFDYLGALAVSLLFPIVLAPKLGLARSAFVFGLLNVAVALVVIRQCRAELTHAAGTTLRALLVLATLGFGFIGSDRLVQWSERTLFGDEIVHAVSSPYQRLVVTRWKDDLRLYINGNLQFSSRDEHRYHEALVHPALASMPAAKQVLVLGGGDGLAVREILKYPQVQAVTLVDIDPVMTQLFSSAAVLTELNRQALSDPRVKVINADAGRWLQDDTPMSETGQPLPRPERYDLIVIDFPDPSNFALGKLYSVPFYRLVLHHLAELGTVVVQSTSPYHAPTAFWTVDATLRAVGLTTAPYHVYVPSFGEWGFILAQRHRPFRPPTALPVPTRYLTPSNVAAMFEFPPDMKRPDVQPNQLNSQSLVKAFEQDWGQVIR